MTHHIRTIDAHVGGQTLRLITEGAPRALGKTMSQKMAWLARHADHLRTTAVLEPRGHADMTAALLMEATVPGADAGLVFMDAGGFVPLSGHGVIAAATIAVERDLFIPRLEPERAIVFETAAGLVQLRPRLEHRGGAARVHSVAFTNMPAFVHTAGYVVALGSRSIRVDLAFGGCFHAIVDTEGIGVPLHAHRIPDLRRLGIEICKSINTSHAVEHPVDPSLTGISGVVFTAPPHDPEADLRNLTVLASGVVDRSGSATGTSAVMAVLDAMGLLPDDRPFVHEGRPGSLLRGRAVRRTAVGETPAVETEIEGTAWITGEHSLLVDDDDPLREGTEW